MKTGIYDLSNEDYHSSSGISRSGVMMLRKSPKHFYHRYLSGTYKDKKTEALVTGSALHMLLLEYNKFFQVYYLCCDKPDRRTAAGKKLFAEIELEANGREIMYEDQFEELSCIINEIRSDELINRMITGAQYEQSLYWNDEDTGVLCKCRPDILQSRFIVDIKTTTDASEDCFNWDVRKYGYHIQAAMMQDGIEAVLGSKVEGFFFVVVEKTPPYAMAVYQLSPEYINRGREQYKEGLEKYNRCMQSGIWPSYEIKEISLPAYV